MAAENNIGIKDKIKNDMLNHYSNLVNMKGTLDTFNKEWVPASKKKKIEEKKKEKRANTSFANRVKEGKMKHDGFQETRHMFDKLNQGVKVTGKTSFMIN